MAEELNTTNTTEQTNAQTDNGTENGGATENNQQTNEPMTAEAIEKLVQSRVDKATAKFGKEKADLQKELDKIKREKLTDEEVKKLEIADREKAITEKEQALLERENRLFAIKAIKEAGLDDGSENSLELVDFVMSNDEAEIKTKVEAFKSLVDKFVSSKVDETFRANGRTPNGSGKGSNGDDKNTSIAETLGKQQAERQKQSNDILNYYYGGKK